MNKIQLSKAYVDEEIKKKILEVVDSGWYILGQNSKELEKEFANFVGTKQAVLTSSGTSAIYLSLLASGVKKGDEIIVPSHTAFPTVEPIFHCGAKPVFIDIDDTYTIDPQKIEKKITKKTVGILPVHLYGHPVDLDKIKEIADKHNLFIIEDCCQAHGALYKNKRVGSIGKTGCFSFYPSKNMTVYGDGGIITTNDDSIAEKCRMLRDHGRKSKYEHEIVGYNLRFNEIQAVVGRAQLQKLDEFNRKRRENAKLYNELLKGVPVVTPTEAEWAKAVYHLYVIRTPKEKNSQIS